MARCQQLAIGREPGAASGPALTLRERHRIGAVQAWGNHFAQPVVPFFVGRMIHLAHARIEARDDARRGRALRDRRERAHPDHRQTACGREPLRDAAGDPQPGERTGPRAVGDAREIADAQTRTREERVDLAQDQLGVALPGEKRALVDNARRADCEGEPLGGRFEG